MIYFTNLATSSHLISPSQLLDFLFHFLLLLYGNDASIHVPRYDLVDLTRQVLAKYANQLFLDIIEAYKFGDLDAVASLSQKFLALVEDMDTLLACHDGFLLGPYLQSAKELAQDEDQKIQVRIPPRVL